ncbi:MAG TPA: hypothetical protein VES79_05110 [Solirubrobacteraceae bacterium]|nr:hypothetical protein [Solirubrobacteraceae bacterium]
MSRLPLALIAVSVLLAGCGSSQRSSDPVEQVPAGSGLREKVRAASQVTRADFPATQGRTLQAVADSVGATGPELGLASSVFTVGSNRLAFGIIDDRSGFVYGKTAIYVAPTPDKPAQGPYPAPADVLITEGRYRSKQAATEQDPFAAVYAAQVPFRRPGRYAVLAVTTVGGRQLAAPSQVTVISPDDDRIPEVGDRPPPVQTDTLASARGDVESIDTRAPPDDMHARSFDDVLGKKAVALLFATPQLCQSRVCGPVVDVALQLKARYGDRVEFIHQEVYRDNKPENGLREPLRRFRLRTEPWLFVVGRDGRITARMEGSFGLAAFERALKTAL